VERGALFLATGKTHCEIGSAREENVETMLVDGRAAAVTGEE
jgi:hypothetical protein